MGLCQGLTAVAEFGGWQYLILRVLGPGLAKWGKGTVRSALWWRCPYIGPFWRAKWGAGPMNTCFPELFFVRNKYTLRRDEEAGPGQWRRVSGRAHADGRRIGAVKVRDGKCITRGGCSQNDAYKLTLRQGEMEVRGRVMPRQRRGHVMRLIQYLRPGLRLVITAGRIAEIVDIPRFREHAYLAQYFGSAYSGHAVQ